ncbi:MAG: Uma2 family endonuclease [Pirellulales bacterium]
MSVAEKPLLTPQEYLAIERQADFRSEFYRGEMFAMSGASLAHNLINANLARKVGNALEEGPCLLMASDMRVRVGQTSLYTYPDMVVVCDDPRYEDDELDTLANPNVIVEVLSGSTEKYDRGAKFALYRQLPSLKEYVLIAQDQPLVERYIRQPDESWVLTAVSGLDQSFSFGTLPATVPLAEIYRNVKFGKIER